jgi:hypothetical protein
VGLWSTLAFTVSCWYQALTSLAEDLAWRIAASARFGVAVGRGSQPPERPRIAQQQLWDKHSCGADESGCSATVFVVTSG